MCIRDSLVYYVKYYLERPDLVGVASLCSMVSSFFAIVLLKVFAKKLGKAKSCALGLAVALVCLVIRFTTHDLSLIHISSASFISPTAWRRSSKFPTG